MAEAKNSDVRTIALRVPPDYHAQITLVAQVDEITLVDLMQRALDKYVAERRAASDFQEKVAAALAEAEAQMARTRAMLLGTVAELSADAPVANKGRVKPDTSG
jgi:hypothetical protein